MQQLSGLDAAFVYLETPRTPMHIGGTYLIDGKTAGKGFGREAVLEHVQKRLQIARTFRQRLIEVPMGLGHPFWIEDPNFEIERHIPHYGVPAPGGKAELMGLSADLFSRPLNRDRPLWELAFVDSIDNYPGLSRGSFALIGRVHHAAVDGASGAEIMGALLDPAPDWKRDLPPDPWVAERIPTSTELVARTYGKLGGKTLDLARVLTKTVSGAGQLAKQALAERTTPPKLPFNAPGTPFNTAVSSRRVFGGIEIELDRVKRIRNVAEGATVNDVLLAICAGGLRDLLTFQQVLPKKSLVAMCPISVRSEGEQSAMGNRVSAMLVEIGTDISDPAERLRAIRERTVTAKGYSQALPADRLMDFVPSETAALASRLYTRMKVADRHRPFFNLVITNVPGPQIPIYLAGAQVTSHLGTAPVFDGVGMILVLFSYAGRVTIGITADRDLLPDTAPLEEGLLATLDALDPDPKRDRPRKRATKKSPGKKS